MIAIPNTVCIVGAFMGVFGLKASLVLNNGFNLIAAANGMLPYTETSNKPNIVLIESEEKAEPEEIPKEKKKEKKKDSLQDEIVEEIASHMN